MGKLFSLLGAVLYYLMYPFIVFIVAFGPIMEFSTLLEVYELEAPRAGFPLSVLAIMGFLLFLSYKYPRLGWLYKKFPVLIPFLQMAFLTFVGVEVALFFANLWADKLLYGKSIAIFLSVLSIFIIRFYLSYWYTKYPISYKLHKT